VNEVDETVTAAQPGAVAAPGDAWSPGDSTAHEPLPPVVARRFELRELLGEGGMGVVVRAFDRVRRQDVALKSMRKAHAPDLFRFKREFRGLADIVHPNLVTLYELVADAGRYWFSMELVQGDSFLSWVRPYATAGSAGAPRLPGARVSSADACAPTMAEDATAAASETLQTAETAQGTTGDGPPRDDARRALIARARLRPDRLRPTLAELARGIAALHDAGRLHCDLKPSNVLIDRTGGRTGGRGGGGSSRVVVCDFGLVVHLASSRPGSSGRVVGTPAYMSPEQAAGESLSPASDWYSFGVMAYEAMSGARPFEGTASAVIEAKQVEAPALPECWDSQAEPALRDLAMALLAQKPEGRPTRADVFDALGIAPRRHVQVAADVAAGDGATAAAERLVGRVDERGRLRAAFERVPAAGGVMAVVSGPSGLGKSTLVDSLRQELESQGALWLHGRCYERESVPFKALDSLVDGLSSHLAELDEYGIRPLLSPDIASLVRLFPVLGRVRAIADASSSPVPQDPQELRNRAFGALRFVLEGLAARRPTAVFIDDLQWGDTDSEPFLSLLAHDPRRPKVLFVATCRAEELDSPLVRTLLEPFSTGESSGALELIELQPLAEGQSRELVRALRPDASDEVVERIAVEAAGNPFLASELALAATGDTAAGASLDDMLRARVAGLEPEARDLVTAAAVAGRPLAASVVGRAAGVAEEARALATLRSARLVRVRDVDDGFQIEPYHDRVREAVVAGLTAEALERLHRRLARALESADAPDVLALVDHWYGAGEGERAARYALDAAGVAEGSLAFDRAAALWGLALDELPLSDAERRKLLMRRGAALQYSGDLAAAADVFASAAEGAGTAERIDLQRRQFELLLHSGRTQRGFQVAESVLREVGVEVPRTRVGALLSVLGTRARLRLRGLEFDEQPPDQIDQSTLQRIDVLGSAASGMALVDTLRGSAYQMMQVRESLSAGEPHRAANALILEIGFQSVMDGFSPRIPPLVERARKLAEARGPAMVGWWMAVNGLSQWSFGNFGRAHELLREGQRLMLEHDASLRWQADVSTALELGALLYLGRTRELCEQVPLVLRDARSRGNEFLVKALLAWRTNAVWLFGDDVATARENATAFDYLAEHSEGFQIYDFYVLNSRVQNELYAGDAGAAYRLVCDAWAPLKRASMLRFGWSRIEAGYLRARAALALARQAPSRRRELLRDARRCARLVARGDQPWGRAKRELILACASALEGQTEAAESGFEEAMASFEDLDMALHAAVARRRWGELVGGDQGALAALAAQQQLLDERIENPDRIVETLAPGS